MVTATKLVVRYLMKWVTHPLILWKLIPPARCMGHGTIKLRVWNNSGRHHGRREPFWAVCPKPHLQLTRVKPIARFQSVVRADEWVGWVGWRHQVVQPPTLFHSWRAAGRTALKYATGEHKEMKVTRNDGVTCRKWYESWFTDGNTIVHKPTAAAIIRRQDNKWTK